MPLSAVGIAGLQAGEDVNQKTPGSHKLHQKKRRLICLQDRLATLKADQDSGVGRLCFGSKRFSAFQQHLDNEDKT